MATFIRVVREDRQPPYGSREILINLNTVWKIEVTYGRPIEEGSRKHAAIPVAEGLKDERAIRFYAVYWLVRGSFVGVAHGQSRPCD
jgi:hypothetical protein